MESKINKSKIGIEVWIGLATVFVYLITVLTQYGYTSYLGLPGYMIEASIKANIIYSFTFLRIAIVVWPVTIVMLLVLLGLFNILEKNNFFRHRPIFWQVVLIIMLSVPAMFGVYKFGSWTAKNPKMFYVFVNDNCNFNDGDNKAIVPGFYEGKPIVLYYNDQKEILNKFSIIDITNTGCSLEKTTIEGLHKKDQ